jgi:hypothetical protein
VSFELTLAAHLKRKRRLQVQPAAHELIHLNAFVLQRLFSLEHFYVAIPRARLNRQELVCGLWLLRILSDGSGWNANGKQADESAHTNLRAQK